MTDVTYFVALPFLTADNGVSPGEAVECFNPSTAVMRAEALSRKPGHVGAIAFSRTGDPATGEFGDAKVIRKFGKVPDDVLVQVSNEVLLNVEIVRKVIECALFPTAQIFLPN
jgi:hypothetical protein